MKLPQEAAKNMELDEIGWGWGSAISTLTWRVLILS
jgi:hypothetical protein